MKKIQAEQFLKTASFTELVDAVRRCDAPFSYLGKQSAMAWLKENRLADYYVVLGCYFDIAVYLIDGTGATEEYPVETFGQYFSSTLADALPGTLADTLADSLGDLPEVPLQSTFEDSFRVTCELYGLEELFQRECEAGVALPSRCYGKPASTQEQTKEIPL